MDKISYLMEENFETLTLFLFLSLSLPIYLSIWIKYSIEENSETLSHSL